MQAKHLLLGYTSIIPAEDHPMRRLLVSFVAVAAVAAGDARPQPQPVWSRDVTEKLAEVTQVMQVGYSADGRTLLALTLSNSDVGNGTASLVLRGFDARDKRELYRTRVWRFDIDRAIGEFRSDPGFAVAPGDQVMTVTPAGLATYGCRDGRLVATHPARISHPGWLLGGTWAGVWATADRRYFLLDYWEGDGPLSRGVLPAGPNDPDGGAPHGTVQLPPRPGPRDRTDPRCEVFRADVSADGGLVALSEEVRSEKEFRNEKAWLALYRVRAGVGLGLVPVARAESPHPSRLVRLKFSPDRRVLATGGLDGELKLWDTGLAGEWKARATIAGNGDQVRVSDIAFRPDGKVVAFTNWYEGREKNVRVVNVESGREVGSFRSSGVANSVCFSPDGRWLVTGSLEGRLEVWDVEQVLATPKQ